MAGSVRGRKLRGPIGLNFRPTTGRVKEFIFSYLGEELEGSKVLDLFSGTGSLGIEALSRGAKEIVFVDRSYQSLKILRKNLETCDFLEKARIMRINVFSLLRKMAQSGETFDFILADPPFRRSLRGQIVRAVDENNLLKPKGLLVVEHDSHDEDLGGHRLELMKQRRFGHCVVSIYYNRILI